MSVALMLRHLWKPPVWMAKNERPELNTYVASLAETVRLSSFRVNADGDMIRETFRSAALDLDLETLLARRNDRKAVAKCVAESLDYLSALIFPRPLPTFRIRRDRNWGRSR